ncbi:MAG: hypothetical protein IT373_05395 [Polyangiaceae bacterium]|nr:hypothetical protein [Polyangiaceae bacterium]
MAPGRLLVAFAACATLAALGHGLAGCSNEPAGPRPDSHAGSSTSTAGGASGSAKSAGVGSASGSPSGTASGTASAEAVAPAVPEAGAWHGTYQAEKDTVFVPEKVPYHGAWAKDDGKQAVGPGKVELTVAPDGQVTGTASGALGDQVIRGVVEGGALRLGLTAKDPRDPAAMSGILTGSLKGDKLVGTLQVASADASLVRQAPVELARR